MINSFEELSKVPLTSEVSPTNDSIKESIANTTTENEPEGLVPHSDDETVKEEVVPDDSDDNDDDSEGKEIVEDVKEEEVVTATDNPADGGSVEEKPVNEVESTDTTVVDQPADTDVVKEVTNDVTESTETPSVETQDDKSSNAVPESSSVETDDASVDSKLENTDPVVTGVSEGSDKTVSIEAPEVEDNAGITEKTLEDSPEKTEDTGNSRDNKLIEALVESVATLTKKLEGFQGKVEGLVESAKLDVPDMAPTDTDAVEETEENLPERKSVVSATEAPEEGTRPHTDSISDVENEESDATPDNEGEPEQTEEEKRASVEAALSNLDAQWPELSPKLTDVERISYLRAIRHIRSGEGTSEDANIIESTHRAVESREKETEQK